MPQDVAREKRPEDGGGWEWVVAVFIVRLHFAFAPLRPSHLKKAFAILERVLERANLL